MKRLQVFTATPLNERSEKSLADWSVLRRLNISPISWGIISRGSCQIQLLQLNTLWNPHDEARNPLLPRAAYLLATLIYTSNPFFKILFQSIESIAEK